MLEVGSKRNERGKRTATYLFMLSSYLKGERREFLGKVGNCFGKKGGELHFFIDKAERGSKKVLFFGFVL